MLKEDFQIQVEFPDAGTTESLQVTQISDRFYRLDSAPLLIETANFRDIVEVDQIEPGILSVIRVAEKSDWKTYQFLLPIELLEKEELQTMLGQVNDLGGYWERAMGGVLFISMPPNTDYDPRNELDKLANNLA